MLVPFLVGFDFPDSTGTSARLSAGGGHYRFTPSCSRYTYGSDFQEEEVSVQHRIATRPVDVSASFFEKIKPGYITFALNCDIIDKQITVLAYDTSADDDGFTHPNPPAGYPTVGSKTNGTGFAGAAKIGLEWTYIGAVVGVAAQSYRKGEEDPDGNSRQDLPTLLPLLGLRLGDEDFLYGSMGFLGSAPLASGGGLVDIGLGGRLGSTRLWGGIGSDPYEDPVFILRASRAFGPLAVSCAGQADPGHLTKDYGASLGIAYLVPWNR